MLALLTSAAVACVDPASYGAVPDDGKPDTAAIQQAIDAAAAKGGKVCLGKGVFHVEKVREFASLLITQGPIEIYGHGRQSIIRMMGPGGRDDWRGIRVMGATGVYLHDFKVDGLDAYDTEEQTHLIELAPNTKDVTISRMELGPMRKPGEKVGKGIGGDCIRLLGKDGGGEVEDVTIVHSKFIDCDRSGIGLQRAIKRVVIAHDTFERTGDQSIDFEPTGHGVIEDIVITHVTMVHDPVAQGPDAIAISGTGKVSTRRVTLSDSKITGGGVRILDAVDVQLLRNTIVFGGTRKAPTIQILRRAANVRIHKNTITRPATAVPGPIVAASHLKTHVPRGVIVEDNIVRQETPANVVNMTSVGGVSVRRNKITYTGNDPAVTVVNVVAAYGDVDDVAVTDNEVTGETSAMITVRSAQHRIRRVDVGGNVAPRTATSVDCRGKPGGFEDFSSDEPAGKRASCHGVQMQPMRARRAPPSKPSATP